MTDEEIRMRETGKVTLYWNYDQAAVYYAPKSVSYSAALRTGQITNWLGSLILLPRNVYRSFGYGFGRRYEVWHVWFVGPDGYVWYGRNAGDNQILRCKRTKNKAPSK